MEFTGNQIKRLGKALRDGPIEDDLLRQLEDYRAAFDPLLIDMSLKLETLRVDAKIPSLLTGRSKRTKSIIRKLKRELNRGMDLSRMADIVGLRLIVENVDAQERMLELLIKELDPRDIHDYRRNPTPSGYRCVHLNIRQESQLLEIQLRTLAQHLWAIESESFGEQTKEGKSPADVSSYLAYIRDGVEALEIGAPLPDSQVNPQVLISKRAPFTSILPTLTERFVQATTSQSEENLPGSFLLVYDRSRGQLLHEFKFKESEREQALREYSTFSRMVDETRFDVLVLNAATSAGLRVTHPQFY
jgi:ppGpp synthetase/RelA/SpoT-type nucleotidyltranferase